MMTATTIRWIVFGTILLVSSLASAMTSQQAETLLKASEHSVKALHKLEAAARPGDPVAEDWLGLAYQSGISKGLVRNYPQALLWFKKAAKQGYANADFNLGEMYQVGAGVPQSYDQAEHWFAKAAALGSVEARYSLNVLRHMPP